MSSKRGAALRVASLAGLLAVRLAAGAAASAAASATLSVEEALALAFPDCEIERATIYLTPPQLAAARELAQVEIASALLHPYRATCGGARAGTAYFDAHTVRTLPETLMVVVGVDGEVRRIEVLSFREPPDYLPRPAWYAQFAGKPLDGELSLTRAVRPVAGATLTARATLSAVRRVLALHRIVEALAP
jgi:FMN-binding domain